MIYHRTSRRFFLQGMGTSLVIPYLSSLMPERAEAAEFPVRYVQLLSPYGHPGDYFYPNLKTAVNGSGISSAALSAIAGSISSQFGTPFDGLKNKMTLVRGLSVLPRAGSEEQHNASYPGAASGVNNNRDPNTHDNYPGFYPYTIDSVLAASAKIYPTSSLDVQKLVNVCPAYQLGGRSNFSWTKINGVVQRQPFTSSTAALLDKFTRLTTSPSPPTSADVAKARKIDVVSRVFADYKAVRNNPKISSGDKARLDNYIGLIDEIQKGLGAAPAPVIGSCQKPSQEGEGTADAEDLEARSRNQLRILAAAMACQLTRVAAVTLIRPASEGNGHTIHHDASSADLAKYMRSTLNQVGFFLQLLDQFAEGSGTLLDNTIVLAATEHGERYQGNLPGHIHVHKDMTVMLAGGGAGAFQMGHYIDYRQQGGRPYNNLLVSIYNAMGLSSADYEREGVVGIGDYEPARVSEYKFEPYVTDAEKRKPLPYLYKGKILG